MKLFKIVTLPLIFFIAAAHAADRLPSPTPLNVKSFLDYKPKAITLPKLWNRLTPVTPLWKDYNLAFVEEAQPSENIFIDFKLISASELKLLQGLIQLEIQNRPQLAYGIFAELIDDSEVKNDATYQIAKTSSLFELTFESKNHLLSLINDPKTSEDKSTAWKTLALEKLTLQATSLDSNLTSEIESHIATNNFEVSPIAHQYLINRAKYYLEQKDIQKSYDAISLIDQNSKLRRQADFLRALILYRTNQTQEAIDLLQKLRAEKLTTSNPLDPIINLTLARIYFQKSDFPLAFKTYFTVDKKHPQWLQAQIEQAWAQILVKDYIGAAGNMFSLHSEFFKKSYHPESYIVRTIAYLNLCQFGDASRVIKDFKKRYTPIQKSLTDWSGAQKSNSEIYEIFRSWAKTPGQTEITGLKSEFLFSWFRTPAFADRQESINQIEDQRQKLDKLALDILATEKLIKQQMQEAKNPRLKYKRQLESFLAEKSRKAIKDFRKQSIDRMDKEVLKFKEKAGAALKESYLASIKDLNHFITQADLLIYEIFSGAGEHLRYQSAGGEVKKEGDKNRLKDKDSLKWDFKGEVWEDELGHFKSSLKNVCPKDANDIKMEDPKSEMNSKDIKTNEDSIEKESPNE
jgi:hypothetical protein